MSRDIFCGCCQEAIEEATQTGWQFVEKKRRRLIQVGAVIGVQVSLRLNY
ncbi:MAG: hypothetical protein MK364_19990 [Pirellulales bacterium]|nr:hypothetical protein [Pirellulales bacterium]